MEIIVMLEEDLNQESWRSNKGMEIIVILEEKLNEQRWRNRNLEKKIMKMKSKMQTRTCFLSFFFH